jgi:threonyl-tRNA synthetase
VGNKEENKITIRKYASNKLNEMELEKFINSLQEEIKNKR